MKGHIIFQTNHRQGAQFFLALSDLFVPSKNAIFFFRFPSPPTISFFIFFVAAHPGTKQDTAKKIWRERLPTDTHVLYPFYSIVLLDA